MTPGKVHEYASCTTFSTTSEYMEGHYTFHRLKNKEEVFDVLIPRFHMVCPPFRESMVRSVSRYLCISVLSKKKTNIQDANVCTFVILNPSFCVCLSHLELSQ